MTTTVDQVTILRRDARLRRDASGARPCRVGVLAFALAASVLGAGRTLHAQNYRYEAETAQRIGTVTSSSVSGYSGTGYVTGFDSGAGTDAVRWDVDVPTGLYEMWVGYRSQFGEKGYNYLVDGVAGSNMFNQSSVFSTDRAGLFSLTGAVNTFQISQGWGYYDVDYVEFRPYTPAPTAAILPELVDPLANYSTRVLMGYLASQYGHKTLSGQQHESSKNLPFPGQTYLTRSGGLTPAIRGSDLIEYSPSRRAFGSNPNNETEQTIAWARQTGGVATVLWHWNAPANLINQTGQEWWRGFYTTATTFNLPGALANPAGQDYQLLLRDIDAIAVELKKYQTAGVPVIWRPLHEAQGGWFWWGAHGPETFKSLWNLTYDRLTDHHGLHNLIWEFTSSAATGNHLAWYPGDDVVDMVSLDVYTDAASTMSGEWTDVLEHYDGRKMIALSETGTLPNADAMDLWDINWSYFAPWTGDYINNPPAAQLQALMAHEDIITLNELPAFPWKTNGNFRSADFDFNGIVDAADFAILRSHLADAASAGAPAYFTSGDADGNGLIDGADFLAWQRQLGASMGGNATPAPEPGSLAALAIACVAAMTCSRVRR